MDGVSFVLALSIFASVALSLIQRIVRGVAIGWQFLRYTVIVNGLLVVALLALNDKLNDSAGAIIAGALGFAFGKGVKP